MQLNNGNGTYFIELELSKQEPIKVDFGIKFENIKKFNVRVDTINTFYYEEKIHCGIIELERYDKPLYVEPKSYKKLLQNVEIV